jgi:uncharacterized protein (UPF0305 family)
MRETKTILEKEMKNIFDQVRDIKPDNYWLESENDDDDREEDIIEYLLNEK